MPKYSELPIAFEVLGRGTQLPMYDNKIFGLRHTPGSSSRNLGSKVKCEIKKAHLTGVLMYVLPAVMIFGVVLYVSSYYMCLNVHILFTSTYLYKLMAPAFRCHLITLPIFYCQKLHAGTWHRHNSVGIV